MPENLKHGPLKGIRVLDMSRILAGPVCTQLLGDYGADVIKVERPGAGDDTRKWGPPYVPDSQGRETKESAYYLAANRNKRSLAIDFSTGEGATLIRKLAGRADVVLENYKVGGLKKHGLDYPSLRADNPGLVYCSITGYGQTGPNAGLPGYDLLAQAYGGIMSLTGERDGAPMKTGVAIADVMCGMYGATAILAALSHRDRTGEGQHIDIALVDTQIAWLVNEGMNFLQSGQVPERRGNQHPNIVPYQPFSTRDGHVIIAVGNDRQFKQLCDVLNVPSLAKDPDFATNKARVGNRKKLIRHLKSLVSQWDKIPLTREMRRAGVPCAQVNNLQQVFESDQVAARNMRVSMDHEHGPLELIGNPVRFSRTPVTYRHAPPVCGADTEQVLDEWLGGGIVAQGAEEND